MDIINVLRKAETKLKKEADHIASQLASLRAAISAFGGKSGRTKRTLSKEARAKIAKAQRARWAKVRQKKSA
jgi:hypothetical protein